MTYYVVDSSVILERIIRTSPLKARVERLFDKARKGGVVLLVSLPTLSEVLYAASRIYSLAGVEQPNEEAYTLVEWVKSRCKLVAPSESAALRAGELKKMLGLALVDCYVIAVAEEVGGRALFLKREREMLGKEKLLEQLPVEFLAEQGS
ncbi:MAG: PIN domain-containing protein [Thermofilum sp.]|jgi:predicted nucleic acid-binding protein|nr:PIN domain-containing protein [Thermofilum sp.]